MSESHGTVQGLIFLSRGDVEEMLSLPDCIDAVEDAFRQHATGNLPVAPGVLGAHINRGGFHIKTAALGGSPGYFAAKVNANFPGNPGTNGLPTIQGVITLFDSGTGRPLAILDSVEITSLRTAAASALAARHLARTNAATVTIVGCGEQGRYHLRALTQVRAITGVFALDTNDAQARRFSQQLSAELGINVTPATDLATALARSDICVTCTPAREPILHASLFRPGLFVAAVGADNPEKQELDPLFLKQSRIVVDIPEQAASMGDLHHAIDAGILTAADIYATLGQIIAGERPGRTGDEDTFVFDSTGTALQDVAAAALVYRRALDSGRGTAVPLTGKPSSYR